MTSATLLKTSARNISDFPFLKNTGEIGDLIVNFDWSRTSLGEIENWPLSLKITLYNTLHSGFPMFLFWEMNFYAFITRLPNQVLERTENILPLEGGPLSYGAKYGTL